MVVALFRFDHLKRSFVPQLCMVCVFVSQHVSEFVWLFTFLCELEVRATCR